VPVRVSMLLLLLLLLLLMMMVLLLLLLLSVPQVLPLRPFLLLAPLRL